LKKIVYTSHLEFRLDKRGIPHDIPRRIYQDSNEKYYDTITGHIIAVDRLDYSGREKEVMIAYDEFEDRIEIVTVHPLKWMQKQQRVNSRRWVSI
jgi:hypothetical protein